MCARCKRLKAWKLHLRPRSCHGRIFVYVKSLLPLTKRDNCVHFRPARGNETQFRDGKTNYQGENTERAKTKKRMQQPELFYFFATLQGSVVQYVVMAEAVEQTAERKAGIRSSAASHNLGGFFSFPRRSANTGAGPLPHRSSRRKEIPPFKDRNNCFCPCTVVHHDVFLSSKCGLER